jgi:predicted branched-subunit amino acid permease
VTITAPLPTSADSDQVRAGARAMAPLIAAYAPFAFLVGTAVAASEDPVAAWLATWLIYGGAAHLAVLDLLGDGAGWGAAAAAGVLVNARLSAYAAAMAPHWSMSPRRHRVLAGVVLTDAPWGLSQARQTGQAAYYTGAAALLFVCWPLMVTMGALVGTPAALTPATGVLAATTLALVVVPRLRARPAVAAVAAAAVTAVVTAPLEPALALGAIALAGSTAGTLAKEAR